MSCARFEESIALRAAGEAGAPDEGELDAHLAACATCREELVRTRALLGALEADRPRLPPEREERFAFAVRLRLATERLQRGDRPAGRLGGWLPVRWPWAAAALGLALAVAIGTAPRSATPPSASAATDDGTRTDGSPAHELAARDGRDTADERDAFDDAADAVETEAAAFDDAADAVEAEAAAFAALLPELEPLDPLAELEPVELATLAVALEPEPFAGEDVLGELSDEELEDLSALLSEG